MKLFKFLFLGVLIASFACTPNQRPTRPTHIVPQVRMEVHADVSFTAHERELILIGAERMRQQTNFFLEYRIVFDLDFDSIDSVREHSKHNILARIDSSAEDIDAATLGYCIVNFDDLDLNNPAKAALIYDRLVTDEVWMHVAMHEMLHMVRLQHINTVKSIMYKSTPVKKSLTCMTSADMVELCTVHGCDIVGMNPCKP